MSKYTIYLRRNKVNGKCYVGQTSNFKQREYNWRCLKYSYTNKYIDEDRAKYGLDNWAVEVLTTADNREDAWEIEQRFINDYNTLWPNGYNIAKGGGGSNGVRPSDETRQKLSEERKGEKNYFYGRKHTDETKEKLFEILANREDMSKQVYQYTLDGELVKVWPSIRECERNGFNHGNVSQCCNGKLKTCKGYKWSYNPL